MSVDMIEKKRSEALTYYNMKRYEQAEIVLKELLALEPESSFALYLLANCYYILDRYEEAESTCRDIATTEYTEEAFRLMGQIYREQKRYKKSEECFLKSLELDPQCPETLAEYSYLLLICGYTDKANEVMQEAMRLDPDNSRVLHFKYYFEHAHGSKTRERQVIEQYMVNSSDEVQKLVKLAMTEYKNNNFKSSREFYRQAFLLDPKNQHILDMLLELDRINHFIFFPNRLFSKVHTIVLYLIFVASTAVLPILLASFNKTLTSVIMIGLSVCIPLLVIWSWLSTPIYKLLIKK